MAELSMSPLFLYRRSWRKSSSSTSQPRVLSARARALRPDVFGECANSGFQKSATTFFADTFGKLRTPASFRTRAWTARRSYPNCEILSAHCCQIPRSPMSALCLTHSGSCTAQTRMSRSPLVSAVDSDFDEAFNTQQATLPTYNAGSSHSLEDCVMTGIKELHDGFVQRNRVGDACFDCGVGHADGRCGGDRTPGEDVEQDGVILRIRHFQPQIHSWRGYAACSRKQARASPSRRRRPT